MTATATLPVETITATESGILITDVRITNFRCLRSVQVTFDKLTVLIGENNSGKTSFLDALYAAIGVSRRSLIAEDIFLAPGEKSAPKSRRVLIDIRLRPTDDVGGIITSFPAGNFWLKHWGNAIGQDDNDCDFVAIRTILGWNAPKGEYIIDRCYLADWPSTLAEIGTAKINTQAGKPSSASIEPLAMYYMDAKRDMHEDMQSRGYFWYKMISDPGLSEDKVAELKQSLSELNKEIITNSKVLAHIQGHLDSLYQTVTCTPGSVCISPLARHLRDISKGIDVSFATKGAQSFPLARHGMGTRSLAAVLTFRAYTTWRQQASENAGVHPVLALEEPEAHLHPQAQRALFRQIEQIPGQRIVSTHSPYIASQSPIAFFRHFRKDGPETKVSAIDTSAMDADDIRAINTMVMATRGDLLYANALVFFEGITEEHSLTEFAKAYFGVHPNDLGISMIYVGGAGNYWPFLRMAESFSIPWYVFSDGETDPVSKLTAALVRIGIINVVDKENIVIIPDGKSFEEYIVGESYEDAICLMLDKFHEQENYLDEFITIYHGQHKKKDVLRDYHSPGGRNRAMIDCLCQGKTMYGEPLAKEITSLADPEDPERRFPKQVRKLLKRISEDQAIPL